MAKIKLNNNRYTISDASLAVPTADFISHLGTVAGNGIKVVVNGVEYSVDSGKMGAAIAELEAVFGNLSGGVGAKGTPVIGTWDGMSYPAPEQSVDAIYFNTDLSAESVATLVIQTFKAFLEELGGDEIDLSEARYPFKLIGMGDMNTYAVKAIVALTDGVDVVIAVTEYDSTSTSLLFTSSVEFAEKAGLYAEKAGWASNFSGAFTGSFALLQPLYYDEPYQPPFASIAALNMLSGLISLTPYNN